MSNDFPTLCAAIHSARHPEFPAAQELKSLNSVAATPEIATGDGSQPFKAELQGLLSEFMRKERLGQVRSAKCLKVRTSKLSRWLRGLSLPNKKDVGRLDKFFGKNGRLVEAWSTAKAASKRRSVRSIRVFTLAEYASRASENMGT